MFKRTIAINKILALKKRIKIVQGGTSAGKTYGILPILINKAILVPKLEISVVAESMPHLRRGALKDAIKILKETNRYKEDRFNRSFSRYQFNNGSYIEFFSVEDSTKLRGARRDILYINECNNITFEAYNELAIRTKREVYLDFNPANEFWVHTDLKDDKDADFLILTYKDNNALDERIIKEIEKAKEKAKTSAYWENWWRVYGLGQIGNLQGVVFSNWNEIDNIPPEAKLLGIGIDFGYSNDPTAIVEVYKWNNKRIVNELCYQTSLVNSEIAKKIPAGIVCYADSAEPKSIEEIRREGKMIKGAKKGKDSILFGIQLMQSQEYLITSQSKNIIKELRSYIWDNDKTGKRLNKPRGGNDHLIDALRYHESESLGNKNYGQYYIK
ncbi:MAG: putative terminase large subunit [Prokaryotic dsDNA virus sp.]|nr:MAG: putative terminase large subunit [Prokaryotic dsDNA virus sp.]